MFKSDALPAGSVRITGGFWHEWQQRMRDVTLGAVYDRFEETGRFAALKCDWKEGMPNRPHIFWDSDAAKWIEGAAYLLAASRDAAVEARVDALVDEIAEHQWRDGYFNSYFISVEPDARFTRYFDHELYCLGHLIEAAVAYDQATGKRKLLDVVIRYAELVDRAFRTERTAKFDTPGHEEIELALYKLYRHTGDERFMVLMRHFIDTRGRSEKDRSFDPAGMNRYTQGHLPVREQATAEGHSVRATYLYCAMADQAWQDGDEALTNACRALFENITSRRMYVTGGIGSTRVGEAFTFDYDLMNRTAYAETCAALGLAFFARRMSRIEPHGEYADAAELALYNGALAGISREGDAFFYENPLEMQPELILNAGERERAGFPAVSRQKVFSCSCCPPNIMRAIASIQDFVYTQSEDTLYVHHYMDSEADTAFGRVLQRTRYPYDGEVEFELPAGWYCVAMRVPAWAGSAAVTINGMQVNAVVEDGYARILRTWQAGDVIRLSLPMDVRLVQAHPALHEDAGRVAVMRGPLVYCAEEVDNGKYVKDIAVYRGAGFSAVEDEQLGVPALRTTGSRRVMEPDEPLYTDRPMRRVPAPVTLIPYFAWANRGVGEMCVWILEGTHEF